MKRTNDKQSNRQWAITALTSAVIIGLSTIGQAATNGKPIGDLEIYAPAKAGTASIFMMLDTSGSMDKRSIRDDYGTTFARGCAEDPVNSASIRLVVYKRMLDMTQPDGLARDSDDKTIKLPDIYQTIDFTPNGCTARGRTEYSRLTRLQLALIELLADDVYDVSNTIKDTGSLEDDYEIGLGNYSHLGNGRNSAVLVPTGALTAEKRIELINTTIALIPRGNTPSAHALAESGAYMMGTSSYDGTNTTRTFSGYNVAVLGSQQTPGGNYISPMSPKACSGNGVYLLTDGEPNASTNIRAKALMDKTLSGATAALPANTCSGLTGGSGSGAWGCMADYAAQLRNTKSNSKGLSIKTATVGFGKDFAGLTGKRDIVINGTTKSVIDCDSGNANQDTRNLCKLGERKGDNEAKTFGDGGFYYTYDSDGIASSVVSFVADLTQTIDTAPAGTITIPNDPYRASNQLPYAYLPMIDPDVDSTASIWKGNLKKYKLNQGTLFGKGNDRLYKNLAGELDGSTQDLWQVTDTLTTNNNVDVGGVYAQLRTPASDAGSVRKVYVEDYTTAIGKKPRLHELQVSAAGVPIGFDELIDTDTYTEQNKRRLLSFLGFENTINDQNELESLLELDGTIPANAAIVDSSLRLSPPTKAVRVLGGVVHSKPTTVSYGATLDDKGRVTSTRDDYVLFGSMDGALHLADSDDNNGKEEFAIIPRSMLINQSLALVPDSTTAKIGVPYFGIDAPWLVTSSYNYDIGNKRVKLDTASGKGMFAYGGMRMGGEGFYGMDITNRASPSVMFTITADGLNNTLSSDFTRLGQTWSKPTAAKIRLTATAEPIDVLIFAGGYDMQYESVDYVPTAAAPARGNAIYIINAETGALVASVSQTGSTSNNANMIHSFVGEVTTLDRDNDGLIDHIYAADLGGQVFRVDFQNARKAEYGFALTPNSSIKRVARILNTAPTVAADKKFAYRFYERPLVSFYRNTSTGVNNGQLFALVNVVSGNRSAPLSKLRDDNKYANRVYGIIDNDVTKADLFATPTLGVSSVTESDLVNLATELGRRPDEAKKNLAKAAMIDGSKKGWYYPLTRFDGYDRVRYNKGVGDSVVINNLFYTTVYNPDKQYNEVDSCTAKIVGGSERQAYCLPYGVCMDAKAVSGTGGFAPVGQGIQELTLGAYDEDNQDVRVIIGTRSFSERIDTANRTDGIPIGVTADPNPDDPIGAGAGGGTGALIDPSMGDNLFPSRYTLQPKVWFERQQ